MRVRITLQVNVSVETYRRLQALMRLDGPAQVQVHTRELPAAHLGDGIMLGVHDETAMEGA